MHDMRAVTAREKKKWKEQSVGGSDDADAFAATAAVRCVCAKQSWRRKKKHDVKQNSEI